MSYVEYLKNQWIRSWKLDLVIFKKISEAIFQTFIKQKFYEKNLNK